VSSLRCVPNDVDAGLPLTCTSDNDCGNGCCAMAFGFSLCFAPNQACLVGTCDPVARDCL
jgi:hypothetical protein